MKRYVLILILCCSCSHMDPRPFSTTAIYLYIVDNNAVGMKASVYFNKKDIPLERIAQEKDFAIFLVPPSVRNYSGTYKVTATDRTGRKKTFDLHTLEGVISLKPFD